MGKKKKVYIQTFKHLALKKSSKGIIQRQKKILQVMPENWTSIYKKNEVPALPNITYKNLTKITHRPNWEH